MATPVLSTKLFVPPRRPRSVARARLIERLDEGRAAGRKLTLISAPVGFGKTTLLSEWLDDIARLDDADRVAWVSLDQGDNDLSRFLDYLGVALKLPPTVTATVTATATGSPESILTAIINKIGEEESSTILILDDFQTIEAAPVRDAVSYVLEHQPQNLHVVLATRSDPLLPLARLRSRGDMTESRAADLRFTPDESATFLNQVMGLDLSLGDIVALESRTEGWIAGLQLAALSLREHSDVTGFIEAFTGSNRFVIDYLGEEVLQRQPIQVRSFLLHTAFLGRMNASLCNALTGRTDGEEMLDALERNNLFLVPLDDERHWYRYHNLFADVLRARSVREDRDGVVELHRLASVWHEENDLPDYAIEYALAGKDFGRAAHLIERSLPEMRRRRQDTTLIAWLKLLPDETVRRMPVLRTFSGWSQFMTGDLDGAERRFSEIEESLQSADGHDSAPGEELAKLPVTIAAYRAGIAQARGDRNATEVHARRALALSPPEDYLGRGSGGGLLALALWAKGDVGSAVPIFREAMDSLELAGHLTDAVSGTVVMADMLAVQGRRVAAREAFERALGLAATAGEGLTIDLHPGMSELCREEDDLEGAALRLTDAAAPGAHAGVPENRHRWLVAMSRVREAEGELDAAVLLLDEAERLYLQGFFPEIRPIPAMRARIWIKQGRLADAAAWAAESALTAADDADYMREFQHITLARLLIARFRSHPDVREVADAMRLLERLLAAAETGGRGGSVNEILVLQALGLEAQGRLLDAMSPLRQVLVLTEPEGYVRLFTDEGTPMATLLDEAGRRAILPHYVRRLRRSFGPTIAVAVPSVGTLSERELTVLRLLVTELRGPEIARELFISLNTLRSHTKHIFEKLAVSSRPEAVRRAQERGLI
jgi:LuxR family maltose regulon positive regulatory protein